MRLPDFIIGGAPKCATFSLHNVLAAHDDIGIPDGEIHFFDADDPITHPDFFFFNRRGLVPYEYAPEGPLFDAYAQHFHDFQGARFIGEDSTAYIFSDVAPTRIKQMLPNVKLIFMLRDPVRRAYSQYWHMVNHGRTNLSFERALTAYPRIVLASTYAPRLERYFQLFGRDQVKVVLFEDFVSDPRAAVDSVTDYLGAPRFDTLPLRESWSNRTYYPRIPSMQLLLNRVRMRLIAGRYRDHLGSRGQGAGPGMVADRLVRRFRLLGHRAPPMLPATHEFLTRHMSERNLGLSAILQRDLSQVWHGFTS
jgi:Sulfotransferase family